MPIENVTTSTWKYIWNDHRYLVATYVLLLILAGFFFRDLSGFGIGLPVLITFFVVPAILGYSFAQKKIRSEFTRELGVSLGFSCAPSAGLDTVSGKLFKTGHSQSLSDVLFGQYRNIPLRVFTFQFTVGSGKDSHTYRYTVSEATLAGNVPDILLYSNQHMSAVSDWFSGDETVELEGDFRKYFRLRVPKGYEQEAYQIFSPDVMAELIDKARDVSFEFIGNKLYVYLTKVINTREEFQSMFDLCEYLTGLFANNFNRVKVSI